MYLTIFLFSCSASTVIYPLSLHDALPICHDQAGQQVVAVAGGDHGAVLGEPAEDVGQAHRRDHGADRHAIQPLRAALQDRKSTRLNSSHVAISYAVFCLKKKKKVKKQKIK